MKTPKEIRAKAEELLDEQLYYSDRLGRLYGRHNVIIAMTKMAEWMQAQEGKILEKVENKDGWFYVRNEIIDRISSITISCPECENIIHSDEQYQCGTCGGGSEINILNWIKGKLKQ